MKPLAALTLAAVLLAQAASTLAQDAPLEIKGLRIGMSKEEVTEKHPNWTGFTVAGARAKYAALPVMVKYHENRLDQLMFFFTPDAFDVLLTAFKEKYPALACKSSSIGNAMGATYEQVQCSLSDSDSVLQVRKYVNDSRTSLLSLHSKRFVEEETKKQREQKKDI
jgi:ABC-type amino acid transport substrate-binding protein